MKKTRRSFLLRKLFIIKLLLLRKRKKRKEKYKKRYWVRRLYQERKEKGEYHLLIQDLKLYDQELFFQYFRMSSTVFETLLSWVAPSLQKEKTKMREPIGPCERLCVTMRYLVTGDAQITLASNFRMSPAVVGRIISETCQVLWDTLIEKGYLETPNSEEDWKQIASHFESRWNFPNAIGAIDGKHVVMQAPARSGSSFFNYKKTHSIVLMAICDAAYKFVLVDIGDSGRQSDGSVYANSHLGYAIENDFLNIPTESKLQDSSRVLPYVFVGDDAFGLKPHMMKPYPSQNLSVDKRVFNYRLSRARRVVENAFGIVASRFRIFRRPIIANVEKVVLVTKAVVSLHNFLMSVNANDNNYNYCPNNFVDQDGDGGFIAGQWRKDSQDIQGLQQIDHAGSNNHSKQASKIRDEFKSYFNAKGAIDWQWDVVNSTGNH